MSLAPFAHSSEILLVLISFGVPSALKLTAGISDPLCASSTLL